MDELSEPILSSSLAMKSGDMANQLHRFHSAIHDETQFTSLDHQSSGSRRRQRAEHRYQSHFGHAAVFPVGAIKLAEQEKAHRLALGSFNSSKRPDLIKLTRTQFPQARRLPIHYHRLFLWSA